MTDDFDPVTYSDVNDAWGGITLRPITAAASTKIAGKLVTKFGGRKMRMPWWFQRTNRSWASPREENTAYGPHPRNGLARMVHDASHEVHRRLHPLAKSHCQPHAALEHAMIQHVVAKGWHQPKPAKTPKPKPTAVEERAQRLARAQASIRRWETKAKRAATALRKLRASERGLLRALA